MAKQGTLFLNEVTNMGPNLQAKFLRLLDTRTFRPVGETKEIPIHTRIIAATNADVERAVKDGELRLDLYHRLNVITLVISPLRERAEDIPYLVAHFLRNSSRPKRFSDSAMEILSRYYWPGNIRELKHTVQRAVFFSGKEEVIEREHLGRSFSRNIEEIEAMCSEDYIVTSDGFFPSWEEIENRVMKQYIIGLLRETRGNQSLASRMSGLTRGTIRSRITDYNISGDIVLK